MLDCKLYFFPGTCARVTLIALAETGIDFDPILVRLFLDEQQQPAFLAINPKGKVPALGIEGTILTETVAILQYLAAKYPAAKLMPVTGNVMGDAKIWSDVIWCASTLHPIVTRIRMPHLFAGDELRSTVWVHGDEAMSSNLALLEERLTGQPWMFGDEWSILDAYVFWIWDSIIGADVDPTPYPALAAHAERVKSRPSVQRALGIEGKTFAQLEAEGTPLKFPPSAKPGAA